MSDDFDDLYGGKYLAASDVKKPATATIEAVEKQDFAKQGERSKMKIVLTLKGVRKPVVVNKTNALSLSEVFSRDFDDWIDKRIQLKAERTQFGGKPVMRLRLYPAGSDAPALKAPPKNDFDDDFSDSLKDL